MRSPLLPFGVRARLYWRTHQRSWVARRPEDFKGKLQWKLSPDLSPSQRTYYDGLIKDAQAKVDGVRNPTDPKKS